jgi:hypothetical protein
LVVAAQLAEHGLDAYVDRYRDRFGGTGLVGSVGESNETCGGEIVDGRRARCLERAELGDGCAVDGDDDPFAGPGAADDRRDLVAELAYADPIHTASLLLAVAHAYTSRLAAQRHRSYRAATDHTGDQQ